MAGNIARKPLEFILIITVHMVLNGPGQAEQAEVITGILGSNITLQFKFNFCITKESHFGVYTNGERKISEYPRSKNYFEIFPENSSVFYHFTNLSLNDSQLYWLILYQDLKPVLKSSEVKLIVFEDYNSTAGPGQAEQAEVITGILGNNITLQFKFNVSITNKSHFGVYKEKERKISEYPRSKNCFEIFPENSSVFYHITNLSLNDSQLYWLSLYQDLTALNSNKVKLIVLEDCSTTTVPLKTTTLMIPGDGNPSFFSSDAVTLLVVMSAVLLAAILSFLICCLVKTKDQEMEPHRNSNPTVQETISTVEFSINVPGPSLVYSVLDFPKRPPTLVEINPTDTEYASVSYLPEKRQI